MSSSVKRSALPGPHIKLDHRPFLPTCVTLYSIHIISALHIWQVVILQPHLSERADHRRAPQKVFALAPQVIDSRVRGRIIAHPGAPGLLPLAQSVMFGYLRLLT